MERWLVEGTGGGGWWRGLVERGLVEGTGGEGVGGGGWWRGGW